VKRREFVRGLVDRGCYPKRHGANHDIYINPANGGVALLCSPSAPAADAAATTDHLRARNGLITWVEPY